MQILHWEKINPYSIAYLRKVKTWKKKKKKKALTVLGGFKSNKLLCVHVIFNRECLEVQRKIQYLYRTPNCTVNSTLQWRNDIVSLKFKIFINLLHKSTISAMESQLQRRSSAPLLPQWCFHQWSSATPFYEKIIVQKHL